jgi:sulfur relay (sulfurtransferase) DsrC/TusE family protein
MEQEIYNFNDLLQVIEQNNFKKDEVAEIIWHTLKIVAFYNSKAELINLLKDFWQKWKDAPETPIFIGLEIQ